jgi:crotonobetainyl-CoA:carnitine CoA-transferase CaiB-like acyl-CoA transferase
MAFKALEGVRVLEYCGAQSGPYCTKLMADLGAEVIHVEPPKTGDDARRSPPFPGDVSHPEKSGLFLYLNTNKLGITLNPELPRGREIFERLACDVDVLVEDWSPGRMEAIGLGYEQLKERNPGLIMASISPFGRSGPYKDYKAYPLNISHVGGQGHGLPLPSPELDRPPTMIGGNCTEYDPGNTAAVAILAALYSRGVTGKGQLVEVSLQEAVLAMQRVEAVISANGGQGWSRTMPRSEKLITLMFPCRDGHVVLVAPLDHQWEALMKLIGNTEWFEKEPSTGPRVRAEDPDAMIERIGSWMKQHSREEICSGAQALSCPIAPVATPEDVANSEQMNARGIFVEMEHPAAGRMKIPSAPYQFSKTPWTLERAAPLLGEHNERIYCERLGYDRDELKELEKAGVI